MRRRVPAAAASAALLLASGVAYGSVLALTDAGPVEGELLRDGAVRRWLGIPYAAPPVGERRWEAPSPPPPWKEAFKAGAYGAACPQAGSLYGPPPVGKAWGPDNAETFGKPVGSEDCLRLNVWSAARDGERLPVIVFVHGGANVAGHSADPIYDGANLAVAARAIVVTLNYRLGIFGWFTHPSLRGSDALTDSGNYGTLDIVEALRFVQVNAATFGGDPDNVTVMGQSAGAINVYSLMASPLAADLFHKAIVLSGLIGDAAPREAGDAYAARLAARLVFEDGLAATPRAAARYVEEHDPAGLSRYLRSKTSAQLLDLLIRVEELRKSPGGFADGSVIPADVEEAFDRGRFRRVPTLVGTTRDEAKLFMAGAYKLSDAQRFKLMIQTRPDAAPTTQASDVISGFLLPGLGSFLYDAYASTATRLLRYGVDRSVERLARHEARVYFYRFDWNQGPEPWRTLYGAAHGIDLPFVFGNFSGNFFSMDFSESNRPGREALSRIMMKCIGGFIRTGNPNTPELAVKWMPWDAEGESRPRLVFDATPEDAVLSVQ